MSFFKTIASVMLAATFCAQASAQQTGFLPGDELASLCPTSVSGCHRYDYGTTTTYVGTPTYITESSTHTVTTTHTKTTTSIFPVVVTRYRGENKGICNIISTTTVTTPQTISVTRNITSTEHRVTSVATTLTSTYYEYVDNIIDCIIPVEDVTIKVDDSPTANEQIEL